MHCENDMGNSVCGWTLGAGKWPLHKNSLEQVRGSRSAIVFVCLKNVSFLGCTNERRHYFARPVLSKTVQTEEGGEEDWLFRGLFAPWLIMGSSLALFNMGPFSVFLPCSEVWLWLFSMTPGCCTILLSVSKPARFDSDPCLICLVLTESLLITRYERVLNMSWPGENA